LSFKPGAGPRRHSGPRPPTQTDALYRGEPAPSLTPLASSRAWPVRKLTLRRFMKVATPIRSRR